MKKYTRPANDIYLHIGTAKIFTSPANDFLLQWIGIQYSELNWTNICPPLHKQYSPIISRIFGPKKSHFRYFGFSPIELHCMFNWMRKWTNFPWFWPWKWHHTWVCNGSELHCNNNKKHCYKFQKNYTVNRNNGNFEIEWKSRSNNSYLNSVFFSIE